jgi:hypothetical protein
MAIVALPVMCVAVQVSAQQPQPRTNDLTPVAFETIRPAQRVDAQNRCIGRAVSGGLIVAAGSFLGIKLLNSAPFADNSPPSDGVVLAISVVAGAGYVFWKSRRCEQVYNGLPLTTWPQARRVSGFNRNAAGFDPFTRSNSASANARR